MGISENRRACFLSVKVSKLSENQDGAGRQAIEVEATEYLGPMAATIREEHFATVGNLNNEENLLSVLEGIAGEVGDDAKSEEFKKGGMARLKRQPAG